MPSAVNAHVCPEPLEIALAFVRPTTATGTVEPAEVPSPSSPDPLLPQQETVPATSSAHVCATAPATATTPVNPLTATGVDASTLVPFPNCPALLCPQHFTVAS